MSEELDALKSELSEWRELARERLNHIRVLEGRLAVIERGCGVVEDGMKEGTIYFRNGTWFKTGTWEEPPTLLGLIEKLGGAE